MSRPRVVLVLFSLFVCEEECLARRRGGILSLSSCSCAPTSGMRVDDEADLKLFPLATVQAAEEPWIEAAPGWLFSGSRSARVDVFDVQASSLLHGCDISSARAMGAKASQKTRAEGASAVLHYCATGRTRKYSCGTQRTRCDFGEVDLWTLGPHMTKNQHNYKLCQRM